jgi:chorismate synthase
MSGNTIGTLFAVTSFGESHGPAIGCVVDGCPPGLAISAADIQAELDRRKPGTSRHVTQRREPDEVEILSGVFAGRTTGAPIALLIRNQDQRSKDYGNIAETFRPGHADYVYTRKYGFAITAAAAVPRRARRQCASPPGRSPASGWPSVTVSASAAG